MTISNSKLHDDYLSRWSLKDEYIIPLLVRGRKITNDLVEYKGRFGGVFKTPDTKKYLTELVLSNPLDMRDIRDLPTAEIIDYLVNLGKRLCIDNNSYLQDAFAVGVETSGLTASVLEGIYQQLPTFFEKSLLQNMVDKRLGGSRYLDTWVRQDGSKVDFSGLNTESNSPKYEIRAFGQRSVHVVAGNVPAVSAITVIRNALTKSDAIIKLPSNDPLTASAIVQTMIDMDPNHPVTRHITCAYWKGGNEEIEKLLYLPQNISRICAWGGMASIQHIKKYLQPGILLVPFDPKLSASIIDGSILKNSDQFENVAIRQAIDFGVFNQNACLNARVVYVKCDPDNEETIESLNVFGQAVYTALQQLPQNISSPTEKINLDLQEQIDGIRYEDDFYKVIGEDLRNGMVIVSQFDDTVDFSDMLCNRVINIVPISSYHEIIQRMGASTQTVGVYPEWVKGIIKDDLPFTGVQRVVSLGSAANAVMAGPHDAIEPMRMSLNWVTNEISE